MREFESSPNRWKNEQRDRVQHKDSAQGHGDLIVAGLKDRRYRGNGATADFSTDRISDTQLLADALIARIDRSLSASHVNVGVSVAPRNLEVRIGPLRTGTAKGLVLDSAVAGLGPVLDRLTEGRHAVQPAGRSEVLTLSLAGQR